LGALGVSPLLNYEELPEPHNTIALRDYVQVVETPKAPVAQRRSPGTAGSKPDAARVFSDFVAPTEIPDQVADEIGLFEESEGVPFGIAIGVPDSAGDAPAFETPEAPPPADPVRVGGQVTAPRKRHHVNPTYPPLAAAARVQGTVLLEATIDEKGNVTNLSVLRSVPLLDRAAIEAVAQWKYEPTLLNGRPVPILLSVSVRFELDR
jgi:protein TonB